MKQKTGTIEWLIGLITGLVLGFLGGIVIAAHALSPLHVVFTDVPSTTYKLWVRQGPTPWAAITPVTLGVPPTTTPGLHAADVPCPLTYGAYEAAVSANDGTSESVLSNVVTGVINTPTETAIATNTATIIPTKTPVPPPTLKAAGCQLP